MAENNNLSLFPGWRTVQKIGTGSFGSVYEIERELFGATERAALKVISIPKNNSEIDELYSNGFDEAGVKEHFDSVLEGVVREYQIMSEMKGHTNIVYCDDIHYGDFNNWSPYLSMEVGMTRWINKNTRATEINWTVGPYPSSDEQMSIEEIYS